MSLIEEMRESIIDGDAKISPLLVQQAIDEGIPIDTILNDGLVDAMRIVGDYFSDGVYFVPEMLLAARAMAAALAVLKPYLVEEGVESLGKVAIATVKGDIHDIGSSLVAMMLEGSGFEVVDLGVDVAPEQIVEAIRDGAKIVALSALLTTTMPNMQLTIDAIEQAGLRHQAFVMVGGAPVTQEFADRIGADGYAPDATGAVLKARELIGV